MALSLDLYRISESDQSGIDMRIPLDAWNRILQIAINNGWLSTTNIKPIQPRREDLLGDGIPEWFTPKSISASEATALATALEASSNQKLQELVSYLKSGGFQYRLHPEWYPNPFFDEVFGLLQTDFPIPTKQTKDKLKIKEFKRRVIEMLKEKKGEHENWPHNESLLVQVSIDCPESYIDKVDVDNFLKLLFDIFKGFVYKDDKQIFSALVDKHVHPKNMIGFMVGVKRIEKDQFFDFWPSLFSSDPADYD